MGGWWRSDRPSASRLGCRPICPRRLTHGRPTASRSRWTAPQILLALSFATTCTIVAAPLVGSLIDRFGARHIIAVSFVCEGLIIASCRDMHDLRSLYLRYAALALLSTGTTAIGFVALIHVGLTGAADWRSDCSGWPWRRRSLLVLGDAVAF